MKEASLKKQICEFLSKIKALGIALSIIITILGICLFFEPIATSSMFIWLIIVGSLIRAVSKIIYYFSTPKLIRNGFDLAIGIFWSLICIIIIFNAFDAPILTTLTLESGVAIIIGFVCVFSGINELCNCNKFGNNKALMIISGILEIICGLLVLSCPLLGLEILAIVYGLYLTILGVALLIKCISFKTKLEK